MLNWLRRWRQARALRRCRIPVRSWRRVVDACPVLQSLDKRESHKLRELTSLFLASKTLTGAAGLRLDDDIRIFVAAQACLPILGLDLSWYDGWSQVIIYPDTFVVTRDEVDENGVVHKTRRPLEGESWSHGPVILSWSDALEHQYHHSADNVIVHEFAHKLDSLNGATNGMPPLHRDMHRETWTTALSEAYEDLQRRYDHGHYPVNPYALENPAEFFAVITEYFFETPVYLKDIYPDVYEQLKLFYRQDPVTRDWHTNSTQRSRRHRVTEE